MTEPSSMCQTQAGTATIGNPCHLSAASAASGLGDWEYLANLVPPPAAMAVLQQRSWPSVGAGYFHDIKEARGDVNTDFYPIEIDTLPVLPNTKQRATPVELFHYLRNNLNALCRGANFEPYDAEHDTTNWTQHDVPLGTVVHIDMELSADWPRLTNVDDGAVVVSEFQRADDGAWWIFSTVPMAADHWHPISGNRQFGFKYRRAGECMPEWAYTDPRTPVRLSSAHLWTEPVDHDVLYFFVKAVDRLTSLQDSFQNWVIQPDMVFSSGHALWTSLQRGVSDHIRALGGEAFVPGWVSRRWNWDRFAAAHMHR